MTRWVWWPTLPERVRLERKVKREGWTIFPRIRSTWVIDTETGRVTRAE